MLLAGCAAIRPQPPASDIELAWQVRQEALVSVRAWEIDGRVGLRTAREGWQASLHWARNADRHSIDLAGPFGAGTLRLVQDRSGAELRDGRQRTYHANDAQTLLYRVTGLQLPLAGLSHWILGLPAPNEFETHELDERGRLRSLTQLGWDIRFLEYDFYGNHELPTKLFIARRLIAEGVNDGAIADADMLEVRVVVQRWTIK